MENLIENKFGNIKFTDSIIRKTILSIVELMGNNNIKLKELKINELHNVDHNYVFQLNVSLVNRNNLVSLTNSFVRDLGKKIELNLKIINPIIVMQLS